MIGPNPKVASSPVLVLATAAIQIGAAFLAISVQQSTGARLDAFLDGLVVLTVFWAIVVLVDMLVFPTQSKTHVVVGPAFLVTIGFAILSVIFRSVEGVMGHSLGLRYAFGRSGYLSSLVWAAASLFGLLTEWFRAKQSATTASEPVSQAAESKPARRAQPAPSESTDRAETPPKPAARRRSAFSAALEIDTPASD